MDADVVLTNEKIAILWNGNWHHKKLTDSHSPLQVKNRDEIKVKEINKCGYTPYIINDCGSYDSSFVESEFKKFLLWIVNRTGVPGPP